MGDGSLRTRRLFIVLEQTSDILSELEFETESVLILECSRTSVDTEKVRNLFNELRQPLNWPYIFKVTGRNGVLPLVSSTLLRNVPDLLDEEIRSGLSEFLSGHVRNNLFQTSKLVEIYNILDAADIPMLPFKGPSLAIQAYGDISMRHFVDLDILVQPRHFDEAVKILQEAGYDPIDKATWIKRKGRFFTRKKDLGFVSEDRQVRLELHWKLSGTHFAMPVEIDELWKRLETVRLGGTEVRSLPFRDLFVYLCLHGSRHGWEKFAWICDINELIKETEKSGNIDWDDVREHARNHGCEKTVELGLSLIHSFFGRRTDYPETARILNDRRLGKIAENIRKNAFAIQDRPMEIGDWYLYHLSLKEKMTDRIRTRMVYLLWYLKIALKPNELDEAVFRLPTLFHPLHYLIRPIRLTMTKRPKVD